MWLALPPPPPPHTLINLLCCPDLTCIGLPSDGTDKVSCGHPANCTFLAPRTIAAQPLVE